jgi:hypothetical protein
MMQRVHKDLNSVILRDFERSQRLVEGGSDSTDDVDNKASILGKRKTDSMGNESRTSPEESPSPSVTGDKRRRVEES